MIHAMHTSRSPHISLLPLLYFSGTLKVQQNHPDWGSAVRDLLNDGIQKPK